MYKQKCIGARGPLMPVVWVLACALILFSVADAGIRVLHWPQWVFAVWAFAMCAIAGVTWRYTRVEMEYMWFSSELVVRRSDRDDSYRLVVRGEGLRGLRDRCGQVGACASGGTALNCCATLRGRLWDCCTLYYQDDEGHSRKLRFQPTPELRGMVEQAVRARANSFS